MSQPNEPLMFCTDAHHDGHVWSERYQNNLCRECGSYYRDPRMRRPVKAS